MKSINSGHGKWANFPIDPTQVLEGEPRAMVRWLHQNGEHEPAYFCGVWRAERSRFRWDFDVNETAHILRGRIRVTEDGGEPQEYGSGDVVFFRKGARTVWDVLEPFEKVFVDSA